MDLNKYFKVKKERTEYLGERYFKFNFNTEKAVQVCITCGDVKKGKSNTFGVYLICKMTLFSNYLAPSYIEPCTKKEFNKQFDRVVKMLQ